VLEQIENVRSNKKERDRVHLRTLKQLRRELSELITKIDTLVLALVTRQLIEG